MARQASAGMIPPSLQSGFFSVPFLHWINLNMLTNGDKWEGLEWNAVFLVLCWWIWKQRNDHIFNMGNLKFDKPFLAN